MAKAQFFENRILDQLLDKIVVGAGEEDIQGFGGLADFGAELLERRFPCLGLGIAGVDAEDRGDECLEVAELFGDRGALCVGNANLVDQVIELS